MFTFLMAENSGEKKLESMFYKDDIIKVSSSVEKDQKTSSRYCWFFLPEKITSIQDT